MTIQIVREETRCRHMGYFLMHHPTDRIAHATAFVAPVVVHWMEREIDRSDDPSRTLVVRLINLHTRSLI